MTQPCASSRRPVPATTSSSAAPWRRYGRREGRGGVSLRGAQSKRRAAAEVHVAIDGARAVERNAEDGLARAEILEATVWPVAVDDRYEHRARRARNGGAPLAGRLDLPAELERVGDGDGVSHEAFAAAGAAFGQGDVHGDHDRGSAHPVAPGGYPGPLEGGTLELIGRQQELELVATAFEDVRAGRARSLAFVGEPGIGKSALLDASARAADGFTIVRLVGAQSESAFPYAGLLALVRPLQDDLRELPGSQADPLRAVLATELAGIEAFAVSAGLLALFAAAAERGPLLVLVDDVQWLDDPTRDALGFVLRRLGADSVAVVLAARPGGLGELARVVETIVDVAPLDDASAVAILETALVASIGGTAQSAVLDAAHGNPLALLELPHRLSVEQREGREPLPPMLVAGALVESAFAQAATGLSASSRTALALAALLEEDGIDVFETAAARLGVSLTDLEPAEVVGMVTLSSGRMTFRHPLVRAAILGAVDDPTLRDVHRAHSRSAPARRASCAPPGRGDGWNRRRDCRGS